MALVKADLKAAIILALTAPPDGQTVDEIADKLATAIDDFVKTGTAGGDPVI